MAVSRSVFVFATVGCLFAFLVVGNPLMAQRPLGAIPDAAESPITLVSAADVLQRVEGAGATVRVLNFWATWCAPCIAEFPDFVALAGAYDSSDVQVDFVSVDFLEDSTRVVRFLDQSGWDGEVLLKAGKDHEFVSAFESPWTGAVPATMVYSGGVLKQYIGGKTDFAALAAIIDESLAVR